LSILVNSEKKLLRAGESFLISSGTPYKPFNETDSQVVIKGPLSKMTPSRFFWRTYVVS
jgi:hypothetical protein